MPLSFAEKRVQTRMLNSLAFWLRPESRTFDGGDKILTEELEKLHASLPVTPLDADLSAPVLDKILTLASDMLIEYGATLGYHSTESDLSKGYHLVSRLPDGNIEKELSFTLSFLRSIIDTSPSIREEREEWVEKVEEIFRVKEEIDEDKAPKLFPSLQDRIAHAEAVSAEEIEELIEKIDGEKSYQDHLPIFAGREYLLKGLEHVQFVQRAFAHSKSIISAAYFKSMFSVMTSLVDRLSDEEISTALIQSREYFLARTKWGQYVAIESTVLDEKRRAAFTARLLILGPTVACVEFGEYLYSVRSKAEKCEKCINLLIALPPPVHQMLLESDSPSLLFGLFPSNGPLAAENYTTSISGLVYSRVFPLLKLLQCLRKHRLIGHLPRVISSFPTRHSLEGIDVSSDEWKETVQLMITSMSAVCGRPTGAEGVDSRLVMNLLELMKNRSRAGGNLLEWLTGYEHHERIVNALGLEEREKEAPTLELAESAAVDEEKGKDGIEPKDGNNTVVTTVEVKEKKSKKKKGKKEDKQKEMKEEEAEGDKQTAQESSEKVKDEEEKDEDKQEVEHPEAIAVKEKEEEKEMKTEEIEEEKEDYGTVGGSEKKKEKDKEQEVDHSEAIDEDEKEEEKEKKIEEEDEKDGGMEKKEEGDGEEKEDNEPFNGNEKEEQQMDQPETGEEKEEKEKKKEEDEEKEEGTEKEEEEKEDNETVDGNVEEEEEMVVPLAENVAINDGIDMEGRMQWEEEEVEEGYERLDATQSSTQSFYDDGFTKSVNNLNTVGDDDN